jgi:hypothetical protein
VVIGVDGWPGELILPDRERLSYDARYFARSGSAVAPGHKKPRAVSGARFSLGREGIAKLV